MINGLIQSWKLFRSSLRGFDTSRQLAMGVVIGMFIGLLPKDSLFSWLAGVALLMTTSNLLTGAISGFSFTWIAALLDPLAHRIGESVLTFDMFASFFYRIAEWPIVPWTRFENTIVTGSLVIAIALTVPVYFIAKAIFDRYHRAVIDYFSRARWARMLFAIPEESSEVAST